MKENTMVNKSTEEIIKKDNRKAGWKFAIIMVLSMLAGGCIGFLYGFVSQGLGDLAQSFNQFMTVNIKTICIVIPIILLVVTVVIAIWCMYNIRYSKKNAFALIEIDDSEELEKIEKKLSYNVCATSLLLIFQYFLFSLVVFADNKYGPDQFPRLLVYILIPFLVGMVTVIVLQQKLVDCTRLLNPEKQGSVYDVNFNKKWEESCDEAEKLIIYKSAYKAYRVVMLLCVILWMIFTILGIFTGIGFLPMLTVIIIWGVTTFVYSYYSFKYQK